MPLLQASHDRGSFSDEGKLLLTDDPDTGIGTHNSALRTSRTFVGMLKLRRMKATSIDVNCKAHSLAGAEIDAEAAALADGLVYFYRDAGSRLGHACYFVAHAPLPPPGLRSSPKEA